LRLNVREKHLIGEEKKEGPRPSSRTDSTSRKKSRFEESFSRSPSGRNKKKFAKRKTRAKPSRRKAAHRRKKKNNGGMEERKRSMGRRQQFVAPLRRGGKDHTNGRIYYRGQNAKAMPMNVRGILSIKPLKRKSEGRGKKNPAHEAMGRSAGKEGIGSGN